MEQPKNVCTWPMDMNMNMVGALPEGVWGGRGQRGKNQDNYRNVIKEI